MSIISSISDLVRFTPTAGGTTDWTPSAAVAGFLLPTLLISGQQYSFRAESSDLSQWEVTTGNWDGTKLVRTNVLFNSAGSGTAQGGAGTKINFSAAPIVGVLPLAEDLQSRFTYVATGFDNTGATDVGAALNTFIQSTPAYSTIILPRGLYFTSATILVNGGRRLVGVGGFAAGNPATTGSCIQGNLTVSPIVQLDGGAGSQASDINGINITRIAGTFGGGVLGLQLWRLNNSKVSDCYVSRSAAGIDLLDLNVTIKIVDTTVFYVTGFYMQMHAQAIEVTCTRVRFGLNGGIDVACTGYLYMDGGGWDTIRFDNCQWNSSIGSVTHGIYFNGYNASNPNGIFRINMLHCEGLTADFIVNVGCTAKVTRFALGNSQINAPGVAFFATAASFDQFKLTGTDINMNLAIDQQTDGQMVGCICTGSFTLNVPNGCAFSGNTFYGTATLAGASAKVAFVGNVVGGALSVTGTGYTVASNA